MNSESIYAILSSKPHNPHYLKRYLKFIEWCKQNPPIDGYIEYHHICPKAEDLFPEYISFRDNPWNKVSLSIKQHIIAHVILWKAYGKSQALAIHYFINVQGNYDSDFHSRKIPTSIQIRYSESARIEFVKWRKGKSTYKDSDGNKYFLKTDDPKIEELNLVGNNHGRVHSEESKQKMSDTKYPNKRVQLYFLDQVASVPLFSDDFSSYIEQGWSTEKLQSDFDYCKEQGNQKNSEFWTNRARYATPDGTYHGSYLKDDPLITELNLVPYRTDAQVEQNASRTVLATEAKLGTQIYNNGIEEKFLREPIDSTWVVGRLERSVEWESKRKAATDAKVRGAKTYNNGVKNIFLQPGDEVPAGFTLGMKCRPNTIYYYVNSVGDVISFKGQHEPPIGYEVIKEREANVIQTNNIENSMTVNDKESAITLVKYCMTGNRLNTNKTWLITKNYESIASVFGFTGKLDNSSIMHHVVFGESLSKCQCCSVHVNFGATYCSPSCRSRMIHRRK